MNTFKFETLYDFLNKAVKSRKYAESNASGLRVALKLFEAELNEEELNSLDVFKKNIEQIYQNVFSKNKNFSAGSLATYKSRVLKVVNDYEKYGQDATKMANWFPKIITRVKKTSSSTKNSKDSKEQASSVGEIDDSSVFVFPFTGGVKLIIPKTPKANDAIMDGELRNIKVVLKDFSEKYGKPDKLSEEVSSDE